MFDAFLWEVERHLTDTFRRVFTEASNMNSSDLEQAIGQKQSTKQS
ncbi:hypothetical protein DW66_3827 [Pseudomonas putida]|nr:hypothetical protein DW66_3827 [Pseudomonas putida]